MHIVCIYTKNSNGKIELQKIRINLVIFFLKMNVGKRYASLDYDSNQRKIWTNAQNMLVEFFS